MQSLMFFQMELVGGKIGSFYESNKVNEPITKVPLKEIKSKMNFFYFKCLDNYLTFYCTIYQDT